jgi:hypothetical protein
MIELTLALLLILGFIALTGGNGQSKKTKPPPPVEPTKQDKAIVEWLWNQFGGAIATMTPAGKAHLIERIKNPSDGSIK